MASEIKVNKITGKGATGGANAPLQFDGNVLTTATIANATIANMINCTFPAGHMIQFVSDTGTTEYSSNTDGWAANGLVDDPVILITPNSATNKILLQVTAPFYKNSSTNIAFSFYKNASDVTETYNLPNVSYGCTGYMSVGENYNGIASYHYVDIAGTTNEITYKISFRPYNTNTVKVGRSNSITSLTVMEIQG